MMETADGMSASTKLVGTMHLVLADDEKEHHAYKISGCIFDPDSPVNILGIPPLDKYLNDTADVNKPFDNNGTTIKSCATKNLFVWDHGRHYSCFMHSSSHMHELNLFVVHGYVNDFCTHIHKFFEDKAHYAFS